MLLLIGSAMTRPVFTTQKWMTPISAWTTQVEISDQFFGWALGFGKKEKLIDSDEVVEQLETHLDKGREMY